MQKKVCSLCDPTLLVSDRTWNEVAREPKHKVDGKFVFTYFLGVISDNRRMEIKKLATEDGYNIIDGSPFLSSRVNSNESSYYDIGPAEFLWLVSHSEHIFTDSFHGVAFSCIFNKHFTAYNRIDFLKMEGRIVNLILDIEKENCKFEFGKPYRVEKESFDLYSCEKKILAIKFLTESMSCDDRG